jgi:glycosyltransferase involved in cell wall biosynthesis
MGLRRDVVDIVPNGAGLVLDDTAPAPAPTEPVIISIGRLERYKGHHRVIEALKLVRQRLPGTRLKVLGEGPYRGELERLVATLGLTDCVEIGAIPPSDRKRLATVLRTASVVTLLSDYEAHPVAVMESLALGCRVLATECSGFIEMAEQGLVDTVPLVASPAQVAEAMVAAIGRSGVKRPIALPSWEDCASRLEQIYLQACSMS